MNEDNYFLNIFFYYKSLMLAYQKKKNVPSAGKLPCGE